MAVAQRNSRASCWCFTLNNWTGPDVVRLSGLVEAGHAVYVVFGREVGESGTPHLQGFVKFASRQRFTQAKEFIGGNSHVEVARALQRAVEYCKKDGDFEEFGVMEFPGKRNDLRDLMNTIDAGELSLARLRELHPDVVARYPRFVNEYISDKAPAREIEAHPLRPWQQDLYHKLVLPPDDRKVTFIVDYTGNSGKTWFAHYYCGLHDNAQVLLPGRKTDMAMVLRVDIRCLFIDAPRSRQGELFQYDFLEEVKNGYVFSNKYESRMKRLPKVHVVVMMNEQPDMTKLSADRYDIVEVTQN